MESVCLVISLHLVQARMVKTISARLLASVLQIAKIAHVFNTGVPTLKETNERFLIGFLFTITGNKIF